MPEPSLAYNDDCHEEMEAASVAHSQHKALPADKSMKYYLHVA